VAKLFCGTSGWSYASWKPKFYPQKLAATKFLAHYASRLNTVEVNYTFRHIASEKTLTNWIAQTPADFKFSIKANQRITHILKLKDAVEPARSFLATLQPLCEADKLAMVLFQLPPFLRADQKLLGDFLAGMPHDKKLRLAFEFRHASWFSDETYSALKSHNAALCIAESEKLEAPDVATADFVYYRLRKEEYSPSELKQIQERTVAHMKSGKDVFVYFKHEETPEGALYAEQLLHGTSAQTSAS
jgi:uncharacterized protein YecE (DUF72 family)